MAIKIGGTTVIDNSRNLTNLVGLKTVGTNSILGSGDISATGGQTIGAAQLTSYSSAVIVETTATRYPLAPVNTHSLTGLWKTKPAVPSTGVLVHYDFLLNTNPAPYPVPNPPDLGGPTIVPGSNFTGQVRTKYRVIS